MRATSGTKAATSGKPLSCFVPSPPRPARTGTAGVPAALSTSIYHVSLLLTIKPYRQDPHCPAPAVPAPRTAHATGRLSAHDGVTKGRETPWKPRREAPAAVCLQGAVHCVPHTSWSESPLCRRKPELEAEWPRSQSRKDLGSWDGAAHRHHPVFLRRLPTTPASRSLSDWRPRWLRHRSPVSPPRLPSPAGRPVTSVGGDCVCRCALRRRQRRITPNFSRHMWPARRWQF